MGKQLIKWLGENFDISRQETVNTSFIYLHDVKTVSPGMLEHLTKFEAFDGIELRDACLTVIVKKAEVDIQDICVELNNELKLIGEQFSEGLICSIEFINSALNAAALAYQAADTAVCSNYHVCTDDNKSCKCKLVEPKI